MTVDRLAELTRREKADNIKPDPDIDLLMKVDPCKSRIVLELIHLAAPSHFSFCL